MLNLAFHHHEKFLSTFPLFHCSTIRNLIFAYLLHFDWQAWMLS